MVTRLPTYRTIILINDALKIGALNEQLGKTNDCLDNKFLEWKPSLRKRKIVNKSDFLQNM